MSPLLKSILSPEFGFAILRVMTPLLFPALGVAISSLSGATNIGLEGIMTVAACAGVLVSAFTHSLFLSLVAGLAAGIGLPGGALNIVTGLGREAGAALAMHRGVEHLSFTGSPATGAWVAGEAAKRHCPVTLELGGKGPQIVFADADLDAALPVIVNSIVQNAGQTCSAGSRLLVERSRFDEVLEKLMTQASPLLDNLPWGGGERNGGHARPFRNDYTAGKHYKTSQERNTRRNK
jgi:hypothetical protein